MGRVELFVNGIRRLPGVRQFDHVRYRRIFRQQCNVNLFYGVYRSFAEASPDIPDSKPLGYDHDAAAKMYGGAEQQCRLIDYPILFWLSQILRDGDQLFDYGGHVGLRYYAFRPLLDFPVEFTWKVWDVQTVVAEGERLAKEAGANQLRFTTSLSGLADATIVLASGSLQYFEEPFTEIMARHGSRPRHILINQLPLHDRHEFVTINNMSTAFCLYKVFRKQSFFNMLREYQYDVQDLWMDSRLKNCDVPFHEKYHGARYYGVYATPRI